MNKTILVVDDENNISTLLSGVLRRRGYEVISTTDPLKVESILDVVNPALIILDYMMPGLNGLDLCRRLRQRASTQHIPIYMLSAMSDTSVMRESRAAGIDEYFSKDEMTGRLMHMVEAALRVPVQA
jgi:two-component system, OmpR family, phosphate regulon response regulator PhoB